MRIQIGTDENPIYECPICGALIADRKLHSEWHKGQIR